MDVLGANMWKCHGRAMISNYGVSDKQCVGSSPSRDTCVLQMGRKAVGPFWCVTHEKEHSALNIEKKRVRPVFFSVDAKCAVALCEYKVLQVGVIIQTFTNLSLGYKCIYLARLHYILVETCAI